MLLLARDTVNCRKLKDIPNGYRLCNLYEYLTSDELLNTHQVSADVSVTGTILRAELFWKERLQHLIIIPTDESSTIYTTIDAPPDDSDTDSDDSNEDSDEGEETPATVGWKSNVFFVTMLRQSFKSM